MAQFKYGSDKIRRQSDLVEGIGVVSEAPVSTTKNELKSPLLILI
jgi:hypothetical protein